MIRRPSIFLLWDGTRRGAYEQVLRCAGRLLDVTISELAARRGVLEEHAPDLVPLPVGRLRQVERRPVPRSDAR